METEFIHINLFYAVVLLSIFAVFTTICFIVNKLKDTNLFKNIFNKHSDEHIEVHKDTTEKIKDIVTWTPEKEQELHSIETKLHDMEVMLIDMNTKLDTLTTRLLFLEKSKRA